MVMTDVQIAGQTAKMENHKSRVSFLRRSHRTKAARATRK
jgi:hypothetical protein